MSNANFKTKLQSHSTEDNISFLFYLQEQNYKFAQYTNVEDIINDHFISDIFAISVLDNVVFFYIEDQASEFEELELRELDTGYFNYSNKSFEKFKLEHFEVSDNLMKLKNILSNINPLLIGADDQALILQLKDNLLKNK